MKDYKTTVSEDGATKIYSFENDETIEKILERIDSGPGYVHIQNSKGEKAVAVSKDLWEAMEKTLGKNRDENICAQLDGNK